MVGKNLLFFDSAYVSDLHKLGTNVSFAQDRGARVLEELAFEFGDIRSMTAKPKLARFKDLALVHRHDYLESLFTPATWAKIFCTQPLAETVANRKLIRRLYREYRLKSGGSIEAARQALKTGLAANLGAGFHHAYADHGDGFCLLNDIVVAVRVLQHSGEAKQVLVIDTDFHQGNGTSKIFEADNSVFTLDVHSKEGWPFHKEKSRLDVAIRKDITPRGYLEAVTEAVNSALSSFEPDLVIFVQGADAYEHGQLNPGEGFSVPLSTMKERDETIIDTFVQRQIPLAMVFAGGYGPRAWQAHYQAVRHLIFRAGAIHI